ncbi:MAG: MoxR family ATPase [Deltaproteobacteria bacterium]|nr:MoxR family ATPase [Deltaproteobacteria bacterium]
MNTGTPAQSSAALPLLDALRAELGRAVVGQTEAVEALLVALVARGHVLLEGVPGVAKTLLAKALARALDLQFRRVQFTPDLMPQDLLGANVFRQETGTFQLVKGPLFTEVLLADELNRTPPKTQSALLEAMEERQVTIDGTRYPLGDRFFVLATQNPLELEGTYPLPEAQTDRFLMKLALGYPSQADEVEVLKRHHKGFDGHDLDGAGVKTVVHAEGLTMLRATAQAVQVQDALFDYIATLCRRTREHARLRLGASPRAAVALLGASKAHAAVVGRPFVTPDDVKAMAPPVLRHRLVLRPEAEIEGLTPDAVIAALLSDVPVPR